MRNVYDALAGLAYGDSLGMSVELWPLDRIRASVGRVEGLLPGQEGNLITEGLLRGEVTDDTHISLILCQQLIEDGELDPDAFLSKLANWAETNERFKRTLGPSTQRALETHLAGIPLEQLGLFGETNGAAMRITPIGIFYDLRDFDFFMEKVYETSKPTHNSSIAVSGAAAIAAAVSYGVHIGDDLQEMLSWVNKAAEAGRKYGRELGYPHVEKRLALTLDLLSRCQDDSERILLLHESLGSSVQTIESVTAALAAVILHEAQIRPTLAFTANLGGDTDTISAMAGAICGALKGAQSLPEQDLALIDAVNGISIKKIASELESAACIYESAT